MGFYNGAVITTAGQNLIAQALKGEAVTWTTLQLSSHDYSGVDLQTLTSLADVEQTVSVSGATVTANVMKVSTLVSNAGLVTSYLARTLGLFGKVGSASPVLVAVMTAITPDEIPAEDPGTPVSFLYDVQFPVPAGAPITVTVNPAGTVTVAMLADYVKFTDIVNNLLATTPGNPLDAVQGKVLNDKIENVSTGAATHTFGTGTVGANSLRRVGRLCTFEFSVYNTSTAATGSPITIPSGFRPKYDLTALCYIVQSSVYIPYHVFLRTTGAVDIDRGNVDPTTLTHLTISVAYIGEDIT